MVPRLLWELPGPGTDTYSVIEGNRVFATVPPTVTRPGALVALDRTTGRTSWGPVDLGSTGHERPGLAVADGRVVVMNNEGRVQTFASADGRRLWQYQPAAEKSSASSPVISGTTVYVVNSGAGRRLTALDAATGRVRWSRANLSVSDGGAPAVVAGLVVLASDCETVAFAADTGAPKWSTPRTCYGSGGRTVSGTGGTVGVPSIGGDVAIRNASTGALIRRQPRTGDGGPNPVSFASGRVVSSASGSTATTLQAREQSSGRVLWTQSVRHNGTTHGTLPPLVVGSRVWWVSNEGGLTSHDLATGTQLSRTLLPGTLASRVSTDDLGLSSDGKVLLVPLYGKLLAYRIAAE